VYLRERAALGWLSSYRALIALGTPLIALHLRRRRVRGREHQARFAERMGRPSRARPPGILVWVHAASVGEAQSSLTLIGRLLASRPDIHILVTTGTVTSAALMEDRLPAKCLHQFAPVDRRTWVRRFLRHWNPDLGIWVESELWPNLVAESAARRLPMALVNARMSDRSFQNWKRARGLIRHLLRAFDICFGQTDDDAQRFAQLGARRVLSAGNLKAAAPPLPADADELGQLQRSLAGRPVWIAASTHPGEEDVVLDAHTRLAAKHSSLLTILAPRHPSRSDEVAALVTGRGLGIARRAASELPTPETAVYLIDTIGEMGLFYRLAEIALIGGSLGGGYRGHNPVEAAQLDAAILHGPDMTNHASIASALSDADAAITVTDAESLAEAVAGLWADPARRQAMIAAAANLAAGNQTVVDRVAGLILPLLPQRVMDD